MSRTNDDEMKTSNYTGPSMNPTFYAGDLLKIVPYGDKEIRIGDVVVFRPPDREIQVVHRVVAFAEKGIRTRGDNNSNIDSYFLNPNDIVGKVVSVQKKDEVKRVHDGTMGSVYAKILHIRKRLDRGISKILHPGYRLLAESGVFRRLTSPWLKTTIICIKKPNGTEMILLLGKRVIGRRRLGQDVWKIIRPFRLLVDDAALPDEDNVRQSMGKNSKLSIRSKRKS